MKANNFKIAGYAAVLALAAFIVEIIIRVASQLPAYSELVSPAFVALPLIVHIALASYATFCLRSFLHERYDYHGADLLIPLLVAGGIVFGLALVASDYVLAREAATALRIGLGVPLGLISIFFGYRLLAVHGDLGGFKKPFAYCHMLAPVCFMTVVLAPLGLLLLIASSLLLALILFSEEDQELDFV